MTHPRKPTGKTHHVTLWATVTTTPSITRRVGKRITARVTLAPSITGEVTQTLKRWLRIGRTAEVAGKVAEVAPDTHPSVERHFPRAAAMVTAEALRQAGGRLKARAVKRWTFRA